MSFIRDPDRRAVDKEVVESLIYNLDFNTISNIIRELNRVINFNVSATEGELYVRDGFDKQLDQLRYIPLQRSCHQC